MNVRRTSLIIVLALALAACAAPIQAPPIRPQQPSAQEALPFVTERQQGQLPAVTAPEVTLPDVFVPEIAAPEIAPPLPLPAGQRVPTVEELTLGVPQQIHEDIARYVEQLQAPAVAPVLKLEEVTRGVPQQIHEDIARFVGAKQFVAEMNQATLPTAILRDQWWVEETTPQPPVTYVDTVRYMMEQATAQEPAVGRGEAYVDTVRYVMLNH